MRFVIFGGGGFIGRHLTMRLVQDGHHLIIPTRHREQIKDLLLLPDVDVVAYDTTNIGMLSKYLLGADAVINLVGILNERRRGDFTVVHHEFARRICDLCIQGNVERLISVSALNAVTSANSQYLQSKANAEQIVRNAGALRTTIIRPSVVYGEGDSFVNLFVNMARRLPFLPLPCAQSVMQPIYVDDLTEVIARVAVSGNEYNKTLSVGGPKEFTLSEIVRAALLAANVKCSVLDLGNTLSYFAGLFAEFTPGVHFYTRDNYLSSKMESTTPKGGNDAQRLLGTLTNLEVGLSQTFRSDINR